MIALALGGRTVAEWQAVMGRAEFLAWGEFYRLFPFDDRHRYHRPAALIAGRMGGDVGELLDWLQPPPRTAGFSAADMNTMRAFGVKPPPVE